MQSVHLDASFALQISFKNNMEFIIEKKFIRELNSLPPFVDKYKQRQGILRKEIHVEKGIIRVREFCGHSEVSAASDCDLFPSIMTTYSPRGEFFDNSMRTD